MALSLLQRHRHYRLYAKEIRNIVKMWGVNFFASVTTQCDSYRQWKLTIPTTTNKQQIAASTKPYRQQNVEEENQNERKKIR